MVGFRLTGIFAAAIAGIMALGPTVLAAQDLVPDRRFVMIRDADFPGGDIASVFDTTLESCQKACLGNQSCTAITFNARNGACFLKADAGVTADYNGAFSARVVAATPGAADLSRTRAAELGFLRPSDFAQALDQAVGLAARHLTGQWSAAEHLAQAATEEAAGNLLRASAFVGAALNITDDPQGWAEYARLLVTAGPSNPNTRVELEDRAISASINAYLRAENPGLRHTVLVTLAQMLERKGRGPDGLGALRLAQELQPRDDTEALLDSAIGKYGFRVIDHEVQSDSARPRLCASFSGDLVAGAMDYAPFVQTDAAGVSVEKVGDSQLCVEGLTHGARYTVTLRAGLPADDGQVTIKPVTISAYVRDRTPSARFPGRAYILPKAADAALPIETVNATDLTLTLFRVTDRNILRAMQGEYFGEPMPSWRESGFTQRIGTELWTGTATVGMEVNRDMTTRLPMAEALAGQPAGIYALKAEIVGEEDSDQGPAWQWFVVTDLGMTSFSGVDGLHVVVRSLGTAGPKPGVTLELLSRANEILATTQTDARGYASFPASLTRGKAGSSAALVVAKEAETDIAFLSLTDPEFDLSDRGVEGREAAPPVDVFLTTDRGAYRAGETIYATALARDSKSDALPGLPLTAILKRPDGVEYSRTLAQDEAAGGHVFALPVAGSAPRGQWRLEVLADLEAAPLAVRTVLVEDFLPERIDFTLTLEDRPIGLDDAPDLTIEAKYLFGAPGADLAIEGEVILRSARTVAGFDGYRFGLEDEPFNTRVEGFGGDVTDAAGRAQFGVLLPQVSDPLRPLEAIVVARVSEGSGRPVERRVSRALAPSAPVIGIKPMFDDVVPEGSDARFSLIALGPDLSPQPMQIAWELTRIETRYQWYQEYGNW
jgi:alpha-2-macroglobulin